MLILDKTNIVSKLVMTKVHLLYTHLLNSDVQSHLDGVMFALSAENYFQEKTFINKDKVSLLDIFLHNVFVLQN